MDVTHKAACTINIWGLLKRGNPQLTVAYEYQVMV